MSDAVYATLVLLVRLLMTTPTELFSSTTSLEYIMKL